MGFIEEEHTFQDRTDLLFGGGGCAQYPQLSGCAVCCSSKADINLILFLCSWVRKKKIQLINYAITSYYWLTTLFCLLRLQIWRIYSYKLLDLTLAMTRLDLLDFDHSNLGLAWDLKVKTWDLLMTCMYVTYSHLCNKQLCFYIKGILRYKFNPWSNITWQSVTERSRVLQLSDDHYCGTLLVIDSRGFPTTRRLLGGWVLFILSHKATISNDGICTPPIHTLSLIQLNIH